MLIRREYLSLASEFCNAHSSLSTSSLYLKVEGFAERALVEKALVREVDTYILHI